MVAKPSWYYNSSDDENFSNKKISEKSSSDPATNQKRKSVFIADANGQVFEVQKRSSDKKPLQKKLVIANLWKNQSNQDKFRQGILDRADALRSEASEKSGKSGKSGKGGRSEASQKSKRIYHKNLINGINYHVYKQLEREGLTIPGVSKRVTNSYVIKIAIDYLKQKWLLWKISRRKNVEIWKVSRRRINLILKKFPTKFLTIVLSPAFAYGLYFFATAPNEGRGQLLSTRFPGLKAVMSHPEKITLNTCKSVSYLKKINWETFRRINYYPGSTFIRFSPDSRLVTDKFLGSAFIANDLKSNTPKTFFLLNREYNICFKSRKLLNFIRKFNENIELASKSNYTQSQLFSLQYFQQHYIRFDVIPTNLGNTFAIEQIPTKKLKSRHRKHRNGHRHGHKHAPLFDKVFQQSVETPIKQSIKKTLKNKSKLEFSQPTITHLDFVRNLLIQENLFSEPPVADYQRYLQYKTANCLGVFREVVGMYVHQGAMIEIEDEVFEIDFYFNDKYNVSRQLAKFITYKQPKPEQRLTRDRIIEYRLQKALIEDVKQFSKEDQEPDIENDMVNKNLTSHFKYESQGDKLNPYGYIETEEKEIKNASAEYIRKQKHANHRILPNFQKTLFKYIEGKLAKNNIQSQPFYLAFNLNSALKTPPTIEGLRVRRYPKLSKQQQKVRRRIIKADSEFLKRQLSGYVFPDSTLKDLYIKQARWENRWFIKGSSIEDDVYIRIVGPPELNHWVFKQVLQLALTPKDTIQIPQIPKRKGFLDVLFNKKEKEITYQPPIHEALIPYERPDPWSKMATPVSMQRIADPQILESQNPSGMLKGTFYGQGTQDAGVKFVEQTPEPKKFNYHKKEKLNYIYSPESDNENKKVTIALDLPFTLEFEDAKNVQFDSDNNTLDVIADNRRPLPKRKLATVFPTTHSQTRTYEPKFMGTKIDLDHFKTHFDIGTKYNSDLTSYRYDRKLNRLTYYNNRFRSKLFVRCDILDPIFLGQIALCIYFINVSRRIYHDYSDSFWEGLEQFLLTIRFQDLISFKSLGDFVIPAKDIKVTFSDFMGAHDLVHRFLPVILFLRSKHYWFSEIPILDKLMLIKPKFSWDYVQNQQAYRSAETALLKQTVEEYSQNHVYSSNIVNTGFLLVGAPGTGKTFLVQALAGETKCPIITNAYEKKTGDAYNPQQLAEYQITTVVRKLFKTAKFRSPSILFIDEIDAIARRRSSVLGVEDQNPLGPSLFYGRPHFIRHQALSSWQKINIIQQELDLNHSDSSYWSIKNPQIANALLRPRTAKQRFNSSLGYKLPHLDVQYYLENHATKQANIDSVTVLLCELDGMSQRENVVVIGATNRPDVIDPALTRPGRLGEIVYLDLPNKQKRLELLKFYAGNTYDINADWEFFASQGQTGGLSSAHLKTAMNISTLALIRQSLDLTKQDRFQKRVLPPHTNATLEYGIQTVKFQNLYVIQAAHRLNRQFHKRFFIPSIYDLLSQQTFVFITKNIETIESKATYLVTHIDGVFVEKRIYMDPSKGADVSAPHQPSKLNVSAIAKKIYQHRFKQLRLLCLIASAYNIGTFKDFQHYQQVGLKYLNTLFQDLDASTSEKLRSKIVDKYGKSIEGFNTTIVDFGDYSHRLFGFNKYTIIGYWLLIDSAYNIDNPMAIRIKKIYVQHESEQEADYMDSNFQRICPSNRNLVNYNLITSFESSTILPQHTKKCATLQSQFFGDELMLQRAAYYNAGKALVIGLLEDNLFDALVLTLWSNIKTLHQGRFTQETFVQSLASQLIARRQFESYLLALIAGKAGEHMLLTNYQANLIEVNGERKSLNYSDIGLEELQQMGWLANIMVEKGLYYHIDSAFLNQTMVPSVPNVLNKINLAESNEGIGKGTAELDLQNSLETIPYWWQSKLRYESTNLVFADGQWTTFYETENEGKVFNPNALYEPAMHEAFTLNSIHNVGYAQMFNGPTEIEILNNQNNKEAKNTEEIKNMQKIENIEQIKNTNESVNPVDQKNEKVQEAVNEAKGQSINFTSLNEETINSLINSADITWNGFASTKVEKMFGQLIFESFNKTFALFEANRPLFDLLVHEFYVNNRMTGLDAKRIVKRFLDQSTYLKKPLNNVPLLFNLEYYQYIYCINFQFTQFKNIPSSFEGCVFYYYGCLFQSLPNKKPFITSTSLAFVYNYGCLFHPSSNKKPLVTILNLAFVYNYGCLFQSSSNKKPLMTILNLAFVYNYGCLFQKLKLSSQFSFSVYKNYGFLFMNTKVLKPLELSLIFHYGYLFGPTNIQVYAYLINNKTLFIYFVNLNVYHLKPVPIGLSVE